MAVQITKQSKTWRRILLGIGGLGVAVAGLGGAGALWLAPAGAQPATLPATPAQPPPPREVQAPDAATAYTASVVARFNEHTLVTPAELGEYLIARYGVEKLDTLINNKIIEKACRERGLTVNGAEVEQRFADDLKGINVDRPRFVKEVLRKARKNLYEWKEDVLRQQLLLAKLCRDQVTVSEEEIRDGFEARYGEKVACRVIHWANEKEANADYQLIRDNEQEFSDKARHQHTDALAATGGKIAAFGRHNLDNKDLENAAFGLQPGEVSPLVKVPDGWIAMKCDGRVPANMTVSLDQVKNSIREEIQERKIGKESKTILATLRQQAQPQVLLERPAASQEVGDGKPAGKTSHAPGAVVATIFNTIPITRQDLGEFLVARFGAEQLELLVNKRIIEDVCRANKIIVTEDEIEAGYVEDYSKRKKDDGQTFMDEQTFIEEVLKPNRTTPYQWREDVIVPRLQLAKLCRDRVKVTEADLHAAFDAYHGEKVECRMILWPHDEQKLAMQNYAKLRDSEKDFDKAARSQASAKLAGSGGKVVIGRHTTGDDDLERRAFALRDGDVSELFGTPQGIVVLKCDGHIPPDTSVSFSSRREELAREVLNKKLQIEIPAYFAQLRQAAKPQLLLKDPNKLEQLKQQVEAEVGDVLEPAKAGQQAKGH